MKPKRAALILAAATGALVAAAPPPRLPYFLDWSPALDPVMLIGDLDDSGPAPAVAADLLPYAFDISPALAGPTMRPADRRRANADAAPQLPYQLDTAWPADLSDGSVGGVAGRL